MGRGSFRLLCGHGSCVDLGALYGVQASRARGVSDAEFWNSGKA